MDQKSPKALLKGFPGQAASQEKHGGERETKDALRGYLSSSSPPPTTITPSNEVPPRPQATGFSPPPTLFSSPTGTSSDHKNSSSNNNSINSNLSPPLTISQLPGLTPQQQQQPQPQQLRPPSSQQSPPPQSSSTKSSAKAAPLPFLKPTVLPRIQRSSFDTFLVMLNVFLAIGIMCTVAGVATLAYAVNEGNNRETGVVAFSSVMDQVFNGINMSHVTNQVMDMGHQMFNQQSIINTAAGGWFKVDLAETGGGFVQHISTIYTQATNYIQKTSVFEQIKLTVDDIILSLKLSFS